MVEAFELCCIGTGAEDEASLTGVLISIGTGCAEAGRTAWHCAQPQRRETAGNVGRVHRGWMLRCYGGCRSRILASCYI